MKRYLALVRLLFVQQFRSRTSLRADKKKRIGTIVLWVVLALCFAPLIVSLAVAMYMVGQLAGGNAYIATMLTLLCQGLVLMFGLHAIMSNVFVVRDADRLLYLPMRTQTIFFAKLSVEYLNELVTSALTVLVLLVPFAIGAKVGVGFYLMLPIALLLIPLLPMLVGTLVAMPLAALANALGKNGVVKTVLRIAIYVAVMALYMFAMYKLGFMSGPEEVTGEASQEEYIAQLVTGLTERLQRVMPYFHPDYMLTSSMLAGSFVRWLACLAAAVGETAVLVCIVGVLALLFYRRMLSSTVEGGAPAKRGAKAPLRVRNGGIVRELLRVDLKKTVRDTQLGFQCFAGILMMPFIVAMMYFMLLAGEGNDASLSIIKELQAGWLYQAIAPLVILLYMSLIGIVGNVLGTYPISRENKSLSTLKSLPVPFGKMLLAKVLLATAVMALSDLLTCVLAVALFKVKWYFGLAMLAVMLLLGFGSMCVTTLVDLKNPRIGWENFNQGLKNAKNSWVSMLVALLVCFAATALSVPFVVLYALLGGWYWLLVMWLLELCGAAGFVIAAYKVMCSRAAKYFERIEV